MNSALQEAIKKKQYFISLQYFVSLLSSSNSHTTRVFVVFFELIETFCVLKWHVASDITQKISNVKVKRMYFSFYIFFRTSSTTIRMFHPHFSYMRELLMQKISLILKKCGNLSAIFTHVVFKAYKIVGTK